MPATSSTRVDVREPLREPSALSSVRALGAAARAAAREQARYRGDLIGSALFLGLILFVFSRLWHVVLQGGEQAGFGVPHLVAYLLITEIVTMSPGPVHLRVSEDVRTGAFSVHLLRPVTYVAWELARAVGASAARAGALVAVGVPVLVLTTGLPDLDPRGMALGLGVLVPLAIVLESAARVGLGLLAFWMEDSSPTYWIWQKLAFVLGGLFLPLEFYPEWLRPWLEALPFAALLHGPARTVVAFEPEAAARAAASLGGWCLVVVATVHALGALGARRVQVNGG